MDLLILSVGHNSCSITILALYKATRSNFRHHIKGRITLIFRPRKIWVIHQLKGILI